MAISSSPSPPGPSIWVVMLALLGTHLAGMGAFLTLPVLAPAIAAETGLPPSLAGLHTSLAYLGALVTGPLTQGLLRRHGGIRVCQFALLAIAAGLALAVLGHPLALLASAILGGLGHGPVTPAGSHILAARTPARIRGLIFGLKQCGVPAGAMLVAALAPLVGSAFGWRWGVLSIALVSLLVAVALQPFRATLDAERDPGAKGPPPWREAAQSLGLLASQPRLRSLTLCACGYVVAQFIFFGFFVVWQVQTLGVSMAEAGARMALCQVAGLVGRVAWAFLADRVGAPRVLLLLGLGATGAALALALADASWPGAMVMLGGLVLGATAVGWTGVMLAEVARVAPQGQVGGATAAMGFAMGCALIFGPSLVSWLVGTTSSYAAGFLCSAVVTLAGLAALYWNRPRGSVALQGEKAETRP